MGEYNAYVGAPYNFAGLAKKVNRENKVQPHDRADASLKSGKIEYEIKAITPIFISAGKQPEGSPEVFYRDCYGRPAVPGSTMRGLVRGNVQILSCSSVKEDIQNASLMYRSVARGKGNKRYNGILGSRQVSFTSESGNTFSMSVLKHVKAGYLRKEGGKFEIIPTEVDEIDPKSGEMNYYVLNERMVMEEDYKGFEDLMALNLQHICKPGQPGKPFQKVKRNGQTHYIGAKNEKYRPFWHKVYYSLKGLYEIEGIRLAENIGEGEAAGMKKGCILSTGPMNEKKAFYIIPEIKEKGARITIPQKDIENYQRDYRSRQNQVEAIDENFFMLPEEGETKPVFYICRGERLYFGFTPRFRLFYKSDIHAGLPREQKEGGVDFCQSLFGYANEEGSYKSRLSFLDATPKQWLEEQPKQDAMILGSPKPTSYLDYLKAPDGKARAVSYNNDFELRGVKQYWLRSKVNRGMIGENDHVVSQFYPYEEGAVFKGEIKFHNLTEAELGMVLWGLLLEKGCQQNIGKGKPYGYGRIAVQLMGLKILDLPSLYNNTRLNLDPYQDETEEKDRYISCAKKAMEDFLGEDPLQEPGIRDFLLMKDAGRIPPKGKVRYMELEEYHSRLMDRVLLQTPEEVLGGKEKDTLIPKDGKGASGEKGSGGENISNANTPRSLRGEEEDEIQSAYTEGAIGTGIGELLKGMKL